MWQWDAQLFAETGDDGINVRKTAVTQTMASGELLEESGDRIFLLRRNRLVFQYLEKPPKEVEIAVGSRHKRSGPLCGEVILDHSIIAINTRAFPIRFNLREMVFSRGQNVTTKRIQPANERAIRMDTTTRGSEEDARAAFVPVQDRSVVMGVALDEVSRGEATIRRQAGDFVRVHLNSLVPATGNAAGTGK